MFFPGKIFVCIVANLNIHFNSNETNIVNKTNVVTLINQIYFIKFVVMNTFQIGINLPPKSEKLATLTMFHLKKNI